MKRSTGLLLAILTMISTPAWAGVEIEPNNSLDQATLVYPAEAITGLLDDKTDAFRLSLPSAARFEVLIDRIPAGSNLELTLIGFGPQPRQERTRCQNEGATELRCQLRAEELNGYLQLDAHFSDQSCSGDWCGAQLVATGPFITLQGANRAPHNWQGHQVIAPPNYLIRIRHPGLPRQTSKSEIEAAAAAMKELDFAPDGWPGGFNLPKGWRQEWQVQGQTALFYPEGEPGREILIRVERRLKKNFPGSSAERQLNLAERDLLSEGGEIKERSQMKIGQRPSPYLVATMPFQTEQQMATTRGYFQLILDFPDDFLWLSYRAPATSYDRYLQDFELLLESFRSRTPFMPDRPQK